MRSVSTLKNLKDKIALVRVDFNIENPADAVRIERTVPTVKLLQRKGAIVVLMSHLGRPRGATPKLSLKRFIPFLRRRVGALTFLPHFNVREIQTALAQAKPGSIFLLENLRFHPGEESVDKAFAKQLASLGDIYVNEAFAVCHRNGASITELPKLLPAYAGLLLAEEVSHLSRVMRSPKKPFVVVLAGGKATDKFAVVENLYPRVSRFLVGGILANTFFKAKGMRVDASVVQHEIMPGVKKFLKASKITLPFDWVSDGRGKILDLGPLSAKMFAEVIMSAKEVIWNGPMGFFEQPQFRKGSETIAKAMASTKAFTVVGGGETSQLLKEMKLVNKINFVSTGGGAMLAFLAGKKLPGITALK